MSAWLRGLLVALTIVTIGLAAVYLQVERVRCGVRLRELLVEEEERRESLRRLEARLLTLCSPDLLLQEVPEERLRSTAGEQEGSDRLE